jgi:putative ABC transport system permease protein
MFSNYFKIALRNILHNKIDTSINLLGLSFGIACVFVITLYLKQELSYDRFHTNAKDLYRIIWESDNSQTRTPHPMAQAMVHDFPQVESAVSLTPLWGSGLTRETHSFRNLEKDERYDEAGIFAVDTTFFDVFSFPLLKGNAEKALKQLNGILISESIAKKYFGDSDPIGKQLAVDSDTLLVEVVGVFKDIPQNSHFHFDFVVSYLREKYLDGEDEFYTWADFGHYNYIRLKPGSDAKELEAQLMDWSKKYINWSEEDFAGLTATQYGFKLQPITDIHLQSRLRWELESNGNLDYIYILGAAALLTLIIASVNFMNLTTAKSTDRAKEIGIRKSLGAFRGQLTLQFLCESLLIAMVAVAFSVLLIEITIPFIHSLTGTDIDFSYALYGGVLLTIGLVIGIASGLYPALHLSAAKPVAILKGNYSRSVEGRGFRDLLIGIQFGISMALISGCLIIFNQLDFLQDRNLGFAKEGVMVVPIKGENLTNKFEALRNELLRIKGVSMVSATSNIPGRHFNQNSIADARFPDNDIDAAECFVDADFFAAMGIVLKDGRTFSREFTADTLRSFVINETAAEQLLLEQPVGAELYWYKDPDFVRGRIVGVVKDFHFMSLHETLQPLLFALGNEYNYMVIKTDLQNFSQKLETIEAVYKQFDPIFAFEFSFLDDQLQQQYQAESNLGLVMTAFSVISIVIASFGLFAMALLTFRQRVKEISIRKVLGATTGNLLYHLLKNFTILIAIAAIVASPLTWWLMSGWLENFSYRITIGPMVFVASAGILLALCWITLSYLTVMTVRLNPAETLKSE